MKKYFYMSKDIFENCIFRVLFLVRWILLAVILGMALGLIGGMFSVEITKVTLFRKEHAWMLYLLPVAGLAIVALYKLDPQKSGTNRVLESISTGKSVSILMAPLIIISTVLTHAFGGSAGREGAALQLGGSIGNGFGRALRLDDYDRKILIMSGMSAAFSALFGTPLTAAIFALEVVSVGMMQYAALVPCSVAALVAKEVAEIVGAHGESFYVPERLELDLRQAMLIVILSVLCSVLSIVFCKMLHFTEKELKELIKNEWLRIIVGAVVIILLTKVIRSTDYLGAGMDIIEDAIAGRVIILAFLWKMIFTSISLGCGFKGGEIVPSLFIGATFGCLFGQLVHLDPSLSAACGMVSVFCGVTNCPISSLFLSFELFGFNCMPFFLLAIGVSYMESGYFGLYHSQKILYSKTKLQFINTKTKE